MIKRTLHICDRNGEGWFAEQRTWKQTHLDVRFDAYPGKTFNLRTQQIRRKYSVADRNIKERVMVVKPFTTTCAPSYSIFATLGSGYNSIPRLKSWFQDRPSNAFLQCEYYGTPGKIRLMQNNDDDSENLKTRFPFSFSADSAEQH